ncbi:aspartate kinase [Oceanispirochaeta sp.]|uniref:aspartate kinase n=1 Tax=Oceanispirochaeta sp. TaxID=2035350 RepID=UPI002622F7AE|nr:aspartate kinase [Oceanispirochaeta sp.]MDA3956546.1 aspartate kinase [Oceanispirochaeta sp.]
MIVMKFGGTSVQDNIWIDKALNIAEAQLDKAPVLVSSAMGKTTDCILELINLAESGKMADSVPPFEELKSIHLLTAYSFLSGENLKNCETKLNTLFNDFISFLKGLSLLRECSSRSQDALLSFGERLSTTIINHRALERNMVARFLDAREFMLTDENFGAASPLMDIIDDRIRERVIPEAGVLLVTQGFIGSTQGGVTTTLGRGGSDYSAAIIASALSADEIQIWTDVNGIMSSDPRTVKGVKTIQSISYREAGELAYFGAKVVHPATIQPAVGNKIPVLVKNTGNPEHPGTRIEHILTGTGLKAIAAKKEITLINISSSKMLNAYGFLSRIFAIFEKYKTPVDLISTSEVSVSITIENTQDLESIIKEISLIASISVEHDKSIICMVGQDLWKDSRFISRVFAILEETPVRMISLGSSDINLSVVVPQEKADSAIQKLHDSFLS